MEYPMSQQRFELWLARSVSANQCMGTRWWHMITRWWHGGNKDAKERSCPPDLTKLTGKHLTNVRTVHGTNLVRPYHSCITFTTWSNEYTRVKSIIHKSIHIYYVNLQQNFRIAKKSGIIFSAYWKYFFVRHSSEYGTSDNSQTPNGTYYSLFGYYPTFHNLTSVGRKSTFSMLKICFCFSLLF